MSQRKHNVHLLGRATLMTLVVGAVGATSPAFAERHNPLEGQPAVRHKMELREGRFEVTPAVGFTLMQDFNNSVMGGAKLGYHIFDWLSIGGSVMFGKSIDTGLKNTVVDTLHAPGTPCDSSSYMSGPPCAEARDAMNYVSWLATAQVEIQPFAGKLGMFSRAFFPFDFFVAGGVGFVGLKNSLAQQPASCDAGGTGVFGCNEGTKIGPTFAAGLRLYFTPMIALQLEYRGIVIKDNQAGRDVNRDLVVTDADQSLGIKNLLTVGVSFFFPTTPGISP